MKFDVKINDTDFSAAFNSIGYGMTYEKVEGTNGGTTQDGTLVEDIKAWKAVVYLPCIDLEEETLGNLLSECMDRSVRLQYYDLAKRMYRSIDVSVTIGDATFLLEDCDGVRVYTGLAITLREK